MKNSHFPNCTIPRFNLIGQRFGCLLVVEFAGRDSGSSALWKCVCDCGNSVILRKGPLANGSTKSCGCYRRKVAQINATSHGRRASGAYQSWASMKQRCLNQKNLAYHNYGARGITICPEWINSFEKFFLDMGDRPRGYSLERIDVNGNYCKSNCAWIPMKEQFRNMRKSIRINYEGRDWRPTELAKHFGIDRRSMLYRMSQGWTFADIVGNYLKPKNKRKSRWVGNDVSVGSSYSKHK